MHDHLIQHDILRNRKRRNKSGINLLIHDLNSQLLCIYRVPQLDFLSIHQHLTGIRRICACKNLH